MARKIPVNLPNFITISRLFTVPALIVVMLFMDDRGPGVALNKVLSIISTLFFALAMGSDMIDGWLARKYHLESAFGKFMDPLADKMLFIAAMIMMIELGRMPAWIVALFFIREVAVTSLRGIAASEGVIIQASHWGKYKSAFVSTATSMLLLHYPFGGVHWNLVGWLLMIPSFVFSIYSGADYAVKFVRQVPLWGVKGIP
jgi:CDP-diacylglycerol--glycerol-3-phosphate 3-phosphatidyltransferase